MNPNFPPQSYQDPSREQFMAEAAAAAAQINAQAAAGNVYGAPRTPSEVNDLAPMSAAQNEASMNLGRVSGAAIVDGANSYVDPSRRGELHSQYANHQYIAQQEQQADFIRNHQWTSEDDSEKVDA